MPEPRRNIWILNHYAGNMQLGMEYRHFYLARHFQRQGHRAGIVASTFHHLATHRPPVDGALTARSYDDIRFCFVRSRPYEGNGIDRLLNTFDYSRGLNRHVRQIETELGRPDVAIGSTPHPFVYFNLRKLQRIYDIPILFEVRDLWPQMLVELGSIGKRHPLAWLYSWIERRAYERADRVLSLWHSADDYMLRHGLDRERYVYLPNGIELGEAAEAAPVDDHALVELVRERRRAGKFVIGYGGSHGFANALRPAIDAMALLRGRGIDDIELVLVGDGPVKADLVAHARQLGLATAHFHGYVTKDVIRAFYDEIDVAYVGLIDLPLFKYGPTPNKLMDYLVAAKPILFAINSSFDPVREADAGLSIPPDDPAAFADAAQRLRDLPAEERRRMGAAGRSYAEANLSYARIAERLLGVVEASIAGRARAAR